MKQKVVVSDKLINNPGFWRKEGESFYYSGHCHRGSAIETDDSCGNCDGANCDTCRKVKIGEHYSFSCYTDTIYKDLLEQGYEEGVASDLAYSDYGCKTHYLIMDYDIPEDVKNLIETPCKEVWDWCNEHCEEFPNKFEDTRDKVKYDCFDMKNAYREIMQAKGISWDDGLDFYLNQVDFWNRSQNDNN